MWLVSSAPDDPARALAFDCPRCGAVFEKTLAWVRLSAEVHCPICTAAQSVDLREFRRLTGLVHALAMNKKRSWTPKTNRRRARPATQDADD
jgi:hypothetical protein